jgi:hypothetical protein
MISLANLTSEDEQRLLACLKSGAIIKSRLPITPIKPNVANQKSDPFFQFPRTTPSSYESSLEYLLQALDGHYVFHISLHSSEKILQIRAEQNRLQETQKRKNVLVKDKSELFSMTDEQYRNLGFDTQQEIDFKRQDYRTKVLDAVQKVYFGSKSSTSSLIIPSPQKSPPKTPLQKKEVIIL